MKRITQITISALATLAVTAALVAPASGYESVNAAANPAAEHRPKAPAPSGTSINAILGESTPAPSGRVELTEHSQRDRGRLQRQRARRAEPRPTSTGFDWDDALIGAGSALVLVLFTGGVMALVRRRRAPRVQPTA